MERTLVEAARQKDIAAYHLKFILALKQGNIDDVIVALKFLQMYKIPIPGGLFSNVDTKTLLNAPLHLGTHFISDVEKIINKMDRSNIDGILAKCLLERQDAEVKVKELYRNSNLKAVDVYALGITLFEIARTSLTSLSEDEKISLDDLIQKMLEPDSTKRITMEEVKQHAYFTQVNPNFFNDLEKQFTKDVTVDDYYVKYTPEKNDKFYALPATIKQVCKSSYDLDKKIDLIESNACKPGDFAASWSATIKNAKQTITDIDIALKDKNVRASEATLKIIRSDINENLRVLHHKMLRSNVQQIPTLDVEPKVLLNQIKTAVNTYLTINKLDRKWFTLSGNFAHFNLHTFAGKHRADALLEFVKEMEIKVSKITTQEGNNGINTKIYNKVIETFESGGNSKQSLNTLLKMHVGSLHGFRALGLMQQNTETVDTSTTSTPGWMQGDGRY